MLLRLQSAKRTANTYQTTMRWKCTIVSFVVLDVPRTKTMNSGLRKSYRPTFWMRTNEPAKGRGTKTGKRICCQRLLHHIQYSLGRPQISGFMYSYQSRFVSRKYHPEPSRVFKCILNRLYQIQPPDTNDMQPHKHCPPKEGGFGICWPIYKCGAFHTDFAANWSPAMTGPYYDRIYLYVNTSHKVDHTILQ